MLWKTASIPVLVRVSCMSFWLAGLSVNFHMQVYSGNCFLSRLSPVSRGSSTASLVFPSAYPSIFYLFLNFWRFCHIHLLLERLSTYWVLFNNLCLIITINHSSMESAQWLQRSLIWFSKICNSHFPVPSCRTCNFSYRQQCEIVFRAITQQKRAFDSSR